MARRDVVERFVAALTGSRGGAVHWQLIPDRPPGPVPPYDCFKGLTDRFWRNLEFENGRGMGIFIVISKTDGTGRKNGNVVALRALFVDDDDGALPPGSPALGALPPSLTVRTKRGWHHYWLLIPGAELALFTPAQLALAAHLGTDPSVKDLPRVMRVPGFLHSKDPADRRLVELVTVRETRYSIEQVIKAFGLKLTSPRVRKRSDTKTARAVAHARQQGAHYGPDENEGVLAAFRRLRIVRWAIENATEVKREVWRGIGTNIASIVLDGGSYDAALELFKEISRPDEDRYYQTDFQRVFQDMLNSAETHGPMLYSTFRAEGVPEQVCSELAAAPVGVARLLVSACTRPRRS